jgi:hypothetical protein
MKQNRAPQAASAQASNPITALFRRIFHRDTTPAPRPVAVPTVWLIDRKRASIDDGLLGMESDDDPDIDLRPTRPLPRVDPDGLTEAGSASWAYSDETVAGDPNRTVELPELATLR